MNSLQNFHNIAIMGDTKNKKDITLAVSTTKEEALLLSNQRDVKLYKRRWYVLIVFSCFSCTQTAVWSTWGPVAQSAKLVFGWTDANIGMFVNLGNIMYILFLLPIVWLMDVKGLRVSLLLCSMMIMLGTSIRCFTTDPETATWLIYIACILNGVGGIAPSAGPALLSATWFPPKQCTTATAISLLFGYTGFCVAFTIGPLLVPEPQQALSELTDISLQNISDSGNYSTLNNTYTPDIRDDIMRLMYLECGVAVVLFLLVLVYFPAKPPSSPSLSASTERTKYTEGLKQLCTRKRFLPILLAYGIPSGVYWVYMSVLNVVLHGVNVSQKTSGWLGFYATVAGCATQLIISKYYICIVVRQGSVPRSDRKVRGLVSDMFLRHMKMLLLVFSVSSTASTTWLVVLQIKDSFFDTVSLYTACILNGVCIIGSAPLFLELSCEASYPIAEGVTAGILTFMSNLTGIVFLSVLQIPNIGVMWMN